MMNSRSARIMQLVAKDKQTKKENSNSIKPVNLQTIKNIVDSDGDDSVADPDYQISSDEEVRISRHLPKTADKVRRNLFHSSRIELEKSTEQVKSIAEKEKTESIKESKPNGQKEKKNCCVYCKKLVCKIARHLENVHKDEENVKKFTCLPKGCLERKQIIETLRRNGDFVFNTDLNYNIDDKIIVCRRPQSHKQRNANHYKACPNCKGFFSKLSLRKHFRRCDQTSTRNHGSRNIMVNSRRIHGNLHKKANEILKNDVFPVLREDEVTKVLRYDELAIIYGNKMCIKYRSKHHHKMIRSRLRLVGRFLLEIKKLNTNISDFASVFEPINYDYVIKAINVVAQLNERTGKYGSPATAFALGTALKLNAQSLIIECIKSGDKAKQILAKEFLDLMSEEITSSVNKTVIENQLEHKREKKITLPTNDDITKLNSFLAKRRKECYLKLKQCFSFENWKQLASLTLISIQVFNRRRPGEIERAKISEFLNCQRIDEDTDREIFRSLSSESQNAARQYVRFQIRGKLARGVPVLIHKELQEYLNLIIRHRKQANVPDENPFIFGLPGRDKYLSAYKLLCDFASKCGATNSSVLRSTQLRKQVATQSILWNLQENEVHDLASFLGHAEKIHREHYRLPIATRDIAQMSRLLELAQGPGKTNESTDEEDEDEQRPLESEMKVAVDYEPEIDLHSINQIATKTKDRRISKKSSDEQRPVESNSKENVDEQNTSRLTCNGSTRSRDLAVGFIQRRTWNTPEKHTARNLFMKFRDIDKLPSYRECEDFISANPCLQTRTPMQLKLWIQNKKIKEKNLTESPSRKNIKRCTWTTPERRAIRKAFSRNLSEAYLPSIKECMEAKQKYQSLKNRSLINIKAYVNNEIRKSTKFKSNLF